MSTRTGAAGREPGSSVEREAVRLAQGHQGRRGQRGGLGGANGERAQAAGDGGSSVEQLLGEGALSEDKRRKVEELIEEEEGATNRFGGWLGSAVIAFAVAVSVFHLYAAAAGAPPF